VVLEFRRSFYYLVAMSDAFPADVKEFLGQNIHSVAQLEVLLMLRAESGRLWTAEDVAKILYVQPPMAKNMLTDLVQRGFVVQSEANFRYQPAGDRIGALIERVAELYRERRVAVTYEIYSKPMNVVQAFADAFRLRKEE
jgi:DNA-binding MarR family transcriptional regulator